MVRFDENTKYFRGYVENLQRDVMPQAHVTITLSSGDTLGPVSVRNIDPGSSGDLSVSAGDAEFETFKVSTVVGALDGEDGEDSSGDFGDIGDIGDPNED